MFVILISLMDSGDIFPLLRALILASGLIYLDGANAHHCWLCPWSSAFLVLLLLVRLKFRTILKRNDGRVKLIGIKDMLDLCWALYFQGCFVYPTSFLRHRAIEMLIDWSVSSSCATKISLLGHI